MNTHKGLNGKHYNTYILDSICMCAQIFVKINDVTFKCDTVTIKKCVFESYVHCTQYDILILKITLFKLGYVITASTIS